MKQGCNCEGKKTVCPYCGALFCNKHKQPKTYPLDAYIEDHLSNNQRGHICISYQNAIEAAITKREENFTHAKTKVMRLLHLIHCFIF